MKNFFLFLPFVNVIAQLQFWLSLIPDEEQRVNMSTKKNLSCLACNCKREHIYSSGRWICMTCRRKKKEITDRKNSNTNKKRGEDRGYDASGAAHNKITKSSHNNQFHRKYR